MHVVKQSEFPIYEGRHEAIISEEDWNLAQAKRHLNGYRRERIRTIRQEQLTGENIYRLLLAFEQLYNTCSEAEQRDLMRALIERIDLYPEKPKDGCWIRKIVFNFPIPINGEEVQEFPWKIKQCSKLYAACTTKRRISFQCRMNRKMTTI